MRTLAALLLSTALTSAQGLQVYENFFLTQRLSDVVVTSSPANISLGNTPAILAEVCNRGPEDIYLLTGGVSMTPVAPTTGELVRSGTCAHVSIQGVTNMSLVSDGNLGTLVSIAVGSGNP